jgi:hypothetical protein
MGRSIKISRRLNTKIRKLVNTLECTKNFICYRSKFKGLCSAKDIGLQSYLLCMEKDPQKCDFSFFFIDEYLCKCPIRICIAKELKK